MTDNTPGKKVSISQFQIKNVTDVNTGPVTPVKIAPPPVTVKRSKSLKSGTTPQIICSYILSMETVSVYAYNIFTIQGS